jgi:hypothetical protein
MRGAGEIEAAARDVSMKSFDAWVRQAIADNPGYRLGI